MSSTGGTDNRSISSGMLPQWMKTKIADRYDLDDAAFSPEDNSFLLIRYPRSMQQPDLGTLCSADDKSITNNAKQLDPLPSQRFLAEIEAEAAIMRRSSTVPSNMLQQAAAGIATATDEGKCKKDAMMDSKEKSVIGVAQDVITNNMFGYRINNMESFKNEQNVYSHRQRRNSKSLPASPLTSPKASPKLRRKNPYFSDPFRKSNENFGKSGWLLSNILSQRKSIEDLVSAAESASEAESPVIQRKNINASKFSILNPEKKQSELREMNFWSPTSM